MLITVIEQFKGRFSPFRFLNELDKMGGRFIGMWIDPVFSFKFPPLKIREDEAILKKTTFMFSCQCMWVFKPFSLFKKGLAYLANLRQHG